MPFTAPRGFSALSSDNRFSSATMLLFSSGTSSGMCKLLARKATNGGSPRRFLQRTATFFCVPWSPTESICNRSNSNDHPSATRKAIPAASIRSIKSVFEPETRIVELSISTAARCSLAFSHRLHILASTSPPTIRLSVHPARASVDPASPY